MLSKISHWLAMRRDDKSVTFDACAQERYHALTRLKNATLDVLHKENAADGADKSKYVEGLPMVSLPREKRLPLTERDSCVGELCVALDECLILGLKSRSNSEQPCWWHVLSASTLILDEPTLVQSVLSAAFLSETDVEKARCWLKIALNNHTIESSIMMIFSMTCEKLIRSHYEEWSLVCCSEGLGLFLELVIALRDVHFAIEVNGESFRVSEQAKVLEPKLISENVNGDIVASITDADIATAVGSSKSFCDSEFVQIENIVDEERPSTEISAIEEKDDEVVHMSSGLFAYRLQGIKPWQYVFGVSLASLSKNSLHSRYALIDPLLALPNILNDCIAIIEEHPHTPRLFRATVLSGRLNQLREMVETEGSVPRDLDPRCAGALVLDFLRNLPNSVVTNDKYDAFVAAGHLRDEDASIRNIACLVNDLPVHCQVVLMRVIGLMKMLQQPENSIDNGVDLLTASSVLAPVIAFKNDSGLIVQSEESRMSTHSQFQEVRYAAVGAQVVERMIEHFSIIFNGVRVQVDDALERLEVKKKALGMVSHQMKLQPNMASLSDRQRVNEMTRFFRDYLLKGDNKLWPGKVCNSLTMYSDSECGLNMEALSSSEQLPTQTSSPLSSTSSGATSSAACDPIERELVGIWEQFGFNRPSILSNFEKGGMLLLGALLSWLKSDSNALSLLKMRALPSELPTYDAGLVASSICESLVKLLKLVIDSKHSEIDIVALSLEPFWKLFDEDMYFNELFMLMFQVFDHLWSKLDPKAASFTRVITETEEIIQKLLNRSPSTVKDLQAAWKEETRIRHFYKNEEAGKMERQAKLVEKEVKKATVLSDPSHDSSLFCISKKKPSIAYDLNDYTSKLLDSSSILTIEHLAYIDRALPLTSQLCRWFRIYSVETNGSSLETLLLLAKKQSPTLLVVKDTKANVFGGFASDEWHRAFHYYGTGESFLFSFANQSAAGGFVKYHWSRKNSYFMLCSDESLIMGGGGNFGLFLDSDFSRGTSGACETFNSPPLTVSQEFSCVQVELWGFTLGEKPTELNQRHKKSVLG